MPSYVYDYNYDGEEQTQQPPLAAFLTIEFEKAVSSMATSSVPLTPQPPQTRQKPPKMSDS